MSMLSFFFPAMPFPAFSVGVWCHADTIRVGVDKGREGREEEEAHPQASLATIGSIVIRQRAYHLIVGIRH